MSKLNSTPLNLFTGVFLCRPRGGKAGGSKAGGGMVDRRRSLDTINGEREKTNMMLEKRISSIGLDPPISAC